MSDPPDPPRRSPPYDHPLSGSGGTRKMLDTLNQRATGTHVVDGARGQLANAMREVIDAMMRSTADDLRMDAAAVLVAEAASRLREAKQERIYSGIAEGSLADGSQGFIDFSPCIGELNPIAPPIRVQFSDDGDVIGTCIYGAAYEGPPGCVHGGFIAAGFDEILGLAQACSGQPGMTGNLNISYRSPTPLGREVRYVGRLDRVDGRKIYASASLRSGDTLCAEAEGLFISMKPLVFERLLRVRLGIGDEPATTPPD